MGPQPWELRKPAGRARRRPGAQASMGPQPWELRKRALARIALDYEYRFNGAAALGAAETGAQRHADGQSARFNGAAALGAAETLNRSHGGCLTPLASMGPQPWELRKPCLSPCVAGPDTSFNGAAALGAAETALAFHLVEIRGCSPCCESLFVKSGINASNTRIQTG